MKQNSTPHFIYLILFTILVLAVFQSCQNQKSGCKNFQTGTFRYGENQWASVKIFREKDSQVEILGDTLKAYFKITWTGDCTYDLVGEKVEYNSEIQPLEVKTLHVTITEIINDSTYRYTSTGGEEGSNEGIIIKTAESVK